jgi:hypothetical protein
MRPPRTFGAEVPASVVYDKRPIVLYDEGAVGPSTSLQVKEVCSSGQLEGCPLTSLPNRRGVWNEATRGSE